MKKLLLLAIVCVFASCNKEQKCKSLIKDYLSKNLDDYSSYESVEYSKLVADSSSFRDDETFKYLDLKEKSFQSTLGLREPESDELMYLVDTVTLDGEKRIDYNDSLLIYMKKSSEFVSSFRPKHIGWVIGHTYRAKKEGNLKLYKAIFHINMNFTKIISVNYTK